MASPVREVGAVLIGVIATEQGTVPVAIDDDVQRSGSLDSGAVSKVLLVEITLVAPAIDMVFGVLGEDHGLLETFADLVSLRGVAAGVDLPFSDGTGVPWSLLSDLERCLSLLLDWSWSSRNDCKSREEDGWDCVHLGGLLSVVGTEEDEDTR